MSRRRFEELLAEAVALHPKIQPAAGGLGAIARAGRSIADDARSARPSLELEARDLELLAEIATSIERAALATMAGRHEAAASAHLAITLAAARLDEAWRRRRAG